MVAVYLVLLPAILSSLLGFTSQDGLHYQQLIGELREAKLKVAQLESALEEISQKVDARGLHIEESERQIRKMEKEINDQQSTLSLLKREPQLLDEKIIALEEEASILWATLRKNNFDIHVLESNVREAEDKVEMVTSLVEKMADIVSEQWIQIQHFEQALQLREMRILKAQSQLRHQRCMFLKYMNGLFDEYLPKVLGLLGLHSITEESALKSSASQTVHQVKRFFLKLKEFHHELQGLIKQEMQRHGLIASLANEELVFFMVSAIIIFPVLSAWMLLSMQFR